MTSLWVPHPAPEPGQYLPDAAFTEDLIQWAVGPKPARIRRTVEHSEGFQRE